MKAREAYEKKGYEVDFRDVVKDRSRIDEMVDVSGGRRQVPVIVEEGIVTIGYGGT